MAGLYFHVPFCKQLCYYCDFHFSLSLRFKEPMLAAMEQELLQRRAYLPQRALQTVYFGGGTPSLLRPEEIGRFVQLARDLYGLAPDAEITVEANPDDLSPAYLAGLRAQGVNRLSIGIQSFHSSELQRMNRRHDAQQALRCVQAAREAGFENLTVDLIYGLPDSTLDTWRYSLDLALSLAVPHYSCYHLGIEEKTAFADFQRKGLLHEVHEDNSWAQYQYLCTQMQAAGYAHYEISNFCLPGHASRHNSAYWSGLPYLGIGPSAHSFDGQNRHWNLAHNQRYLQAVQAGSGYNEGEVLNQAERLNDYLLTRLRTADGIHWQVLQERFATRVPAVQALLAKYSASSAVWQTATAFGLTEQGMFQSDAIIADFFQLT